MVDQLLILNKDSDTLSVLEADTGETDAVVETDFTPHEITATPDESRAFVANYETNDGSVIDCEARVEIGRYETELHPDGIASLSR